MAECPYKGIVAGEVPTTTCSEARGGRKYCMSPMPNGHESCGRFHRACADALAAEVARLTEALRLANLDAERLAVRLERQAHYAPCDSRCATCRLAQPYDGKYRCDTAKVLAAHEARMEADGG